MPDDSSGRIQERLSAMGHFGARRIRHDIRIHLLRAQPMAVRIPQAEPFMWPLSIVQEPRYGSI